MSTINAKLHVIDGNGNTYDMHQTTSISDVDGLQTALNAKANASDVTSGLAGKVDKESGKGLSTNDFTTTEKNKLSGIEAQANKTVVDSELNSSSTNPVQNKVMYNQFELLKKIATPEMFGAVCDGETDDTTAFINCLTSSYNVIMIDKNIKVANNTTITMSNKIVLTKGNAYVKTNSLRINGSNNDITLNVQYSEAKGVLISGDNNTIKSRSVRTERHSSSEMSYSNYCICIYGNKNTVKECFAENGSIGISVEGDFNTVEKCTINEVNTGIFVARNTNNNRILFNNIYNSTIGDAKSGFDGILTQPNSDYVLIEGNIIRGFIEHGMYIQTMNSKIVNNKVHNNAHSGIKIASYDPDQTGYINYGTIILGNTVYNNNDGIYVQNVSKRLIVSSNCVYNCPNSCKIVTVLSENYPYSSDLKICDNHFDAIFYITNIDGIVQILNNESADFEINHCSGKVEITGNCFNSSELGGCINAVVKNNFLGSVYIFSGTGWIIEGNTLETAERYLDLNRVSCFNNNSVDVKGYNIKFTDVRKGLSICDNVFYVTAPMLEGDAVITSNFNNTSKGINISNNRFFMNGETALWAIYVYCYNSVAFNNVVIDTAKEALNELIKLKDGEIPEQETTNNYATNIILPLVS